MLRLSVFFGILTLYGTNIDSARILGVYPTPSISHQVVFRALTLELVKRGHEVVVITTDPAFRNKIPPENLTEIDIGRSYELLRNIMMQSDYASIVKRGVVTDMTSLKLDPHTFLRVSHDMFAYPEVRSLIADKSQKFDLVLVEALYYSSLIFSEIYKVPAILFSSFYGSADNFQSVGAVSRHPIFHPHMFRNKLGDLNIWEKIQEIKNEWNFYMWEQKGHQSINEFLKSEFGTKAPTTKELISNVELLFVNAHPIFDGNRAIPPGVVYLGGLHLTPVKPLPEDLQSYLDDSTRGVIYVSLGSNVRPSLMDEEMLDAFLNAFEALPYDILWKFEGDNLKRTPKNVRVQKWFPQRDLLGHPNIKLFITQGGLQSTDEAIDAELPMVGIPFLGDQWFNVNKYVELGIGVEVDALTLTADKIVEAAFKVIGDDSYKKNIVKLRALMRDQPETSLERAVWWTEYVIRHGRSRSLLPAYALLSWSEWLMADVIMVIGACVVGTTAAVAVLVYYAVSLIMYLNRVVKVKQA